MDTLIDFLLNNYIWFLIISLILVFALIGYLVDITTPKLKNKKEDSLEKNNNVENAKRIKPHPSVEAYTNEDFDKPLIDDKNI